MLLGGLGLKVFIPGSSGFMRFIDVSGGSYWSLRKKTPNRTASKNA